jgi:hypothetical protein
LSGSGIIIIDEEETIKDEFDHFDEDLEDDFDDDEDLDESDDSY